MNVRCPLSPGVSYLHKNGRTAPHSPKVALPPPAQVSRESVPTKGDECSLNSASLHSVLGDAAVLAQQGTYTLPGVQMQGTPPPLEQADVKRHIESQKVTVYSQADLGRVK